MYLLLHDGPQLLIHFALKSGLIRSQGRMLMVWIPSLIHIMLLIELSSTLIAPHLHCLELLQLPLVHVNRPTEGDMGANCTVV